MDGIGLLFFILPGVIAYAVDFTTGCIYLNGKRGSFSEAVPLDPTKDVNQQADQILYANYGGAASTAIRVDLTGGLNDFSTGSEKN